MKLCLLLAVAALFCAAVFIAAQTEAGKEILNLLITGGNRS